VNDLSTPSSAPDEATRAERRWLAETYQPDAPQLTWQAHGGGMGVILTRQTERIVVR